MATNKKSLAPTPGQAPKAPHSNVTKFESSTRRYSAATPRRPTKAELLFLLLVERGQLGVTGLDAFIHCGLISGRNELNELEHQLIIRLGRQDETNAGGGGRHTRYRLQWRGDATAVIGLIQTLREKRKAQPLAPEKVSELLARYPVKQ